MRLSRKNQTYCILRISHIFCNFFYKFPNLPWIIRWEYKIERHRQYPFPMLTRKLKLKWWNKFNFDHICQELQKNTSSSQTETSNFLLEKSQVQCQLASVSDKRQFKKQLLKAASQISDDEDDIMMESSSPNYRTHPEISRFSRSLWHMIGRQNVTAHSDRPSRR